jgi:protein TonB
MTAIASPFPVNAPGAKSAGASLRGAFAARRPFADARAYDVARVLVLVLTVHGAGLWLWLSEPESAPLVPGEMQVAVQLIAPTPVAAAAPPSVPVKLRPKKSVMPRMEAERVPQPAAVTPAPSVAAAVPAAPVPVQAAAPVAITSAPVLPDAEPSYKAAYLRNPPPPYPLSARRMGIEGRVVLNVEVLAEGACGQASIHQSSGYAMLDNSALQTVKTWRFIPARHAGQSVTQWFKVPIQFTLKDNEA